MRTRCQTSWWFWRSVGFIPDPKFAMRRPKSSHNNIMKSDAELTNSLSSYKKFYDFLFAMNLFSSTLKHASNFPTSALFLQRCAVHSLTKHRNTQWPGTPNSHYNFWTGAWIPIMKGIPQKVVWGNSLPK